MIIMYHPILAESIYLSLLYEYLKRIRTLHVPAKAVTAFSVAAFGYRLQL